jgi:hypothetical protein
MTKQDINDYFKYFINNDPYCEGLEKFLGPKGVNEVFERLKIENDLNLNKVQLNQLFIISGLTNISFGFFKYYWLTVPENHPYNLTELVLGYAEKDSKGDDILTVKGGYLKDNIKKYFFELDKEGNPKKDKKGNPIHKLKNSTVIDTIEHFRWGLLRIYTDTMFYFGNITLGFNILNKMGFSEINNFFKKKAFDTEQIIKRGHCMDFYDIEVNDRYLISEAVCKNLDAADATKTALREKLRLRFREASDLGLKSVKVGVLLDKDANLKRYRNISSIINAKKAKKVEYTFEDDITTTEFIEMVIKNEQQIDEVITPLYDRFINARKEALQNTKLYLSLLNDMDVYVATSMRSKDDFLTMATNCYKIFHDNKIKKFQLRYFDPTISAAEGHDDKGLIECLMVQCAKVLIYTSGDKDSYGKDAEAAMALSSGKLVIFYCPDEIRHNVAKNIHPLTKLIDFESGVANGAMVAKNINEVVELLRRIFENKMQYMLTSEKIYVDGKINGEKIEKTHFKLRDTLTATTVRYQTSDLFLYNSFWNYYDRHLNYKEK